MTTTKELEELKETHIMVSTLCDEYCHSISSMIISSLSITIINAGKWTIEKREYSSEEIQEWLGRP